MIDEEMTVRMFSYTSDMLAWKSHKKIVVMCDECGVYRIVGKADYRDLCKACACREVLSRPEVCLKISNKRIGKKHSEETILKMKITSQRPEVKLQRSLSNKGRVFSEEHKQKIGDAHRGVPKSEESKRKHSATHQGIPYEEWESFAVDQLYCPKFNESCRESNREKYGRRCFICGKPESENITTTGKQRKLSVHHVDRNKSQGCDGHDWVLVPLCLKHHGITHNELWTARIIWLLNNVW